MKHLRTIIPIAALLVAPLASHATLIFSDTFGSGSTINGSPAAPTATTAAYQNWSQGANPAGFAIAPGALHLAARPTTSVFGEVQAQFASSPVNLASVGDTLNFVMTFTAATNVLLSGQNASAQITIGLYNSGGTLPLTGSRLDAGTAATGGTAGYLGYIGRMFLNGNASLLTRPAQSGGATSSDQDLLFNNAGGGAFNSPTAALIGTSTATGFTTGLTQGNQYTIDFQLVLTSLTTLSITESLYDGASTGSPLLATQTQVASGATLVATSIDSLAFGWRKTGGPGEHSAIDINSITVDYTTVPEPSTIALLGVAGLGLITCYRRFRS